MHVRFALQFQLYCDMKSLVVDVSRSCQLVQAGRYQGGQISFELLQESRAYKQSMIAEEVQEIFVQRTLLVRQQNIARRNYKLVNWLKLLTLHQQDKNQKACDDVIRNEIHQNFVMQEGFWIGEANKRFAKEVVQKEDIQLVMLSIDDGAYHRVSTIIADKVIELYKQKKLRQSFCLSVLEKFITHFSFESGVGDFFKKIRQIYQEKGEAKKMRASFQRQIKLAHDNFDLVWDQYQLWETDQKELEKNRELYQQAKLRWEREVVEFDEDQCSQTNVKLSLFLMENVNQSKIDEKRFMLWVEKLPTEAQKLWFLRRIALNFKQLLQPYLIKLQSIYSNDDQSLIKKYKIVIRLSENNQQIQLKYLHFLVRRISKHLLNQPLEQNYNDTWSAKVVFFRQEITAMIQKQRTAVTPQESKALFKKYSKLWIDVQANIIKDKDSVCQLYENLIKQTEDFTYFQNYAENLVVLGALKQAKNVLKRYVHHQNSQRSRQLYLNFIEMYGTAEDQAQYYKQLKPNYNTEPKATKVMQVEQSDKASQMNHNQYLQKDSKSDVQEPNSNEQNKLKRERTEMKDEGQLKIEAAAKKRIHVDGQNTIYIKGIPTDWSEEDVRKILIHQEKDVAVRISLVVKSNQQKDYCYVQYSSKEMAEDEVKNNKSGYKFYISRPPSDYDQSSTLFLCALPLSATQDKIRQLFKQHADNIKEIRLKLNNQKNYAYVEFSSPTMKQQAFQTLDKITLLIDGKKILVQHCDSSKSKTKKFSLVAFLKNLAFKTQEKDIHQFFAGKELAKVNIPIGDNHRPKGFAYVEFVNEKDFEQALETKKGVLHGRQFTIHRSDREITMQRHQKHGENAYNSHQKGKIQNSFDNDNKRNKNANHRRSQQRNSNRQSNSKSEVKDNNYFSSLFK